MSNLEEPSPEREADKAPSVGRQQLLGGAAPVHPMVGKTLADRYVITEFLGSGAMGVVYKARHAMLNRDVAIKVLKHDIAEDETSRRRFETESMAAGSLTHPNLIAVHDCGFADDATPFLVMDFLEGESLAAVLKREKRLEPLRLVSILKQVCAGLYHAHSKGLVHRDLKPNNIMLLPYAAGRDLVKVVDFGIVKSLAANQDLTQTGEIFGTPYYMSPEQCQGQKVNGRSDIYSLGCVVYRLLAGKPPFAGDMPVNTIRMHVMEPPPPIPDEQLDSEVLKALVPIVMKMLAKEPAMRFQTAEELRLELEQIERDAITARMTPLGLTAVEAPTPEVPVAKPNMKMILATIAACLVGAMIIAGAVGAALFSRSPSPPAVQAPQLPPPAAAPANTPPSPAPARATTASVTAPVVKPKPKVTHRRAAAKKPRGIRGLWRKFVDAID